MTTPSEENQAALPLEELELTPQWVKSPERDYSRHQGGGDRPGRDGEPRERFRGPRRPRPSGPPSAERPAGKGERRGPDNRRPSGQRGPRRPNQPERPPPAAPVDVTFLPEEHGFAAMIETIRQSPRAYPLFDLARLVLNKPERHVVKLQHKLVAPDKPRPPLYCVPATGDIFLDQEDALRFLFTRRLDVVGREKKSNIEPPKGNFTFVNRCGITGVWLGPPNFHEYQARIIRHHQTRLRHMPFEQFRAHIQTVRDPEAVKAWIESMSVKSEFECVLCAPPPAAPVTPPTAGGSAEAPAAAAPPVKMYENREDLEKHVREAHLDGLFLVVPEVIVSGPASRQIQNNLISNAIRLAWESERKFPIRTVNEVRPRLQRVGLHFFKHPNGVTFISRIKPQRFEAGQELTEQVRKILALVRSDGKCSRKKLMETLFVKPAPEGATASTTSTREQEMLLADFHWLLAEGYLIELSDGGLWSPPDKTAPPTPVVTVTEKEIERPMNYIVQPTTLGLKPSFGFGDRIGAATPGHIEAMRRAGQGIAPIYIQQSIREMTRTGRSPRQVMDDAQNGIRRAGWDGVTGADADHLKTTEDVDRTAAVGFTFFTIDPSGAVDQSADSYDLPTLETKFAEVRAEIDWYDTYCGHTIPLGNGTAILFTDQVVKRAAVKYGRAIRQGIELSNHIRQVSEAAGRDYEIELSVDETPQPTTLAEHYIIAEQCLKHGMKLVSLAPRFIGDLEKGVDYIGDVAALEASLHDHNSIAEHLGPYKLSLHSGSDKLSMYTAFARATKGRFHVKTAGTSYLEALRVVLIHEPGLFRRITDFARECYDTDKATYHVHATLADVPPQAEVPDDRELERHYLERWDEVPAGQGFTKPGRQILHCTFGTVLTHLEFGPALRQCLHKHPETYKEVLAVHFVKHLEALQAGM